MTETQTFDAAIACARTRWLQDLLRQHLPELVDLTDSPDGHAQAQAWDQKLKSFMVKRGLTSPTQQKNRLTDIRNALKTLDPQHPALTDVGFTPQQWLEINAQAETAIAHRQTQFLENPDALVQHASALLESHDWYDVAAGLAVCTGRRIAELLKTAEFTVHTPYSLLFTGAVKRRQEKEPLRFEIPTLAPAPTIVTAIANLRQWLSDAAELTIRELNSRYEHQVAVACDRAFSQLVPARDGQDSLYTHLFRSIYATIATHWYCPPHVSDLEYRATIQGHYKLLDEHNHQKRLSMASQKHYWDYKIGDGQGNVDGRLGVKLNHPDVTVLETFQRPQADTATPAPGHPVSVRIWKSDRQHLHALQQQLAQPNQASTLHLVLQLTQTALLAAQKLELPPPQLTPEKLLELTSTVTTDAVPSTTTTEQTAEQLSTLSAVITEQQQSFSQMTAAIQSLVTTLAQTSSRSVSEPEPPTPAPVSDAPPKADTDTNSLLRQQQQSLHHLTDSIQSLVHSLNSGSSLSPPPQTKPVPSNYQRPVPVSSTRNARSTDGERKVERYIDAIIAYNNAPNLPHKHKWRVSLSGLKTLTHCSQQLIRRVLDSRADELQQHHEQHQLGLYHNNKNTKGVDKAPSITEVIQLI